MLADELFGETALMKRLIWDPVGGRGRNGRRVRKERARRQGERKRFKDLAKLGAFKQCLQGLFSFEENFQATFKSMLASVNQHGLDLKRMQKKERNQEGGEDEDAQCNED